MSDGGLRQIFQRYMPTVHWQAIETGGTGRGIPDLNGCVDGREFWVELKATDGWRVAIRPEQVAWIERRTRAGGNVTLAVRQRGAARDALWILDAQSPRRLINGERLSAIDPLGCWQGGPAMWNWPAIQSLLTY